MSVRSLRSRLILGLLAGITLFLAVSGTLIYGEVRSRMYGELEQIDPLVNPVRDEDDRAERLDRLDKLDSGAVVGSVPKSYTDDIYKLRRDIDLVRRRLDGRSLQG